MANTTWFNLRNQIIKEIIEKAEPFISAENYKKIKNIEWFNLPNTLNKIQAVLKEELEGCVEVKSDKIVWFNLPKKVDVLIELVSQLEDC